MNIKYEKQIQQWLELRNDQQTARKALSDHAVNCHLYKLDLISARKTIPFKHINPTDLNYKLESSIRSVLTGQSCRVRTLKRSCED